ncbi:MAG: glycogen synthase GlgA [Brevinematales bacterium]|nr:glycogen synthase GlgA [Brevinematales bacterium]
MPGSKPHVLLVATEVSPLAKVGGLADVVGALAKEFQRLGKVKVSVALPRYHEVDKCLMSEHITPRRREEFAVAIGTQSLMGAIEHVVYHDIDVYLVDQPHYFKRNGIYFDETYKIDYADNLERMAFFTRFVFEALKVLDLKVDVIHAHDWQCGLFPFYLKSLYKMDGFFKNTKSVFTIHNLSYQGIFSVEQYGILGVDWKYFTINGLEFYGHINLLKAGINFSDMITVVSETYAKEIQLPEFGNGLEGIIREKAAAGQIVGIMNGVDYEEWNPETDEYLPVHYTAKSLDQKKAFKMTYLKDKGISQPDPGRPLLGMVSRLVDQKGLDILLEIVPQLMEQGVYLTVLGQGKEEYEVRLRDLARHYAPALILSITFDVAESHRIIAASDMLLVPSRFEPAGLTQLYAMAYGTLPVVRKTGGLADSVKHGVTGFVFEPYTPEALLGMVSQAIATYKQNPTQWEKMMKNAMKEDFSWKQSAHKYLEIYKHLLQE